MGIVIFGSSGQLAQSLRDTTPVTSRPVFIGRDACDLADPAGVNAILEKEKPELIINAAAYTAVDKAEEEPQQAQLVNEEAVRGMARYARISGAAVCSPFH